MDGQVSNTAQLASIRRYILADGIEKGIEVLDCDNGRIRFLLNVSAALDMMQLYHLGENISFISKNGFVERDLPFVRRFEGGMLYTCGLDSVGDREGHEVHGTLHLTPARVTLMRCDEQGITVEAEVKSGALFGKDLLLKRRYFAPVMGDFVTLEDTLVNVGYTPADYCILYHVNAGYPLLDEGATLKIDGECTPRTPWAAENICNVRNVIAPDPARLETCYFWKLNTPAITLSNKKLGKALTLTYSADTLPHFVQWQSMASGDYALGIEPTTTLLDDRFAYCKLEAAGEVKFALKWSISAVTE
jgi:hypothetical protein